MHPLSGSNIGTLAAVLSQSGGISPANWARIAGITAAILGRWPFSTAEHLYASRLISRNQDMEPPIFIVGHWRSGTTHLYNIMSKANFGYVPPLATGLPWDLLGIATLLRPLLERALPDHRYIDNVPVLPDSPQEDEIALANMTPLSFYHGIYFPKNIDRFLDRGLFFDGCSEREIEAWQETFKYFLAKLYIHQDHKQLLIKNPVYTARVGMLHDMIPTAKFIHINRNPYEIFESMRNFWKKLLKEFALQDYAHVDIDQTIFRIYERMMTKLEQDWETLPSNARVDLRYEELVDDPIGAVETIYRTLELDSFEAARPKFEAYLSTVKTYKKNKYAYTDEAATLVEQNWGRFLKQWNYRRPGSDLLENSAAGARPA